MEILSAAVAFEPGLSAGSESARPDTNDKAEFTIAATLTAYRPAHNYTAAQRPLFGRVGHRPPMLTLCQARGLTGSPCKGTGQTATEAFQAVGYTGGYAGGCRRPIGPALWSVPGLAGTSVSRAWLVLCRGMTSGAGARDHELHAAIRR